MLRKLSCPPPNSGILRTTLVQMFYRGGLPDVLMVSMRGWSLRRTSAAMSDTLEFPAIGDPNWSMVHSNLSLPKTSSAGLQTHML